MGFRRRPPLRPREIGILLGLTVATLAVVGGLLAADIRISQMVGGGGEFYSLWAGSRAVLLEQRSPYSAEIAGAVQQLAYGRAAIPGENPYRLTVSLFLLPLFFPCGLVWPPAIARGIWLGLSQAALVGSISISLSLVGWRPRWPLTLLIGFLAVFGVYAVLAMLAGTPAIMLTLLYFAILWALRSGRGELAGALIALSLFTWEVGALFLIVIAWLVFHERRWNVLAGLAMVLVLLLGLSFLLDPGWVLPFLTSVVGQMRSLYGTSTSAIMSRLSPDHGILIARSMTILLLSLFIYEWWSARHGDAKGFLWLSCLALAVTPLLGLRTEASNLVVLGPGMVLITAASVQRRRSGGWLGLLLVASVFLVPWFLLSRWLGAQEQAFQDYLFLFYPLASIAGLYWTRWWFLRPQRTWLDEVRAAQA